MKKHILLSISIILTSGLILSASAQKASGKQSAKEKYNVSIVDSRGLPVEGAVIFVNEGKDFVRTDASGKAVVKTDPADVALVEAEGFETMTIDARKLALGPVTLTSEKSFEGAADIISLPFRDQKKINNVGAVTNIDLDAAREVFYSNDWNEYLKMTGSGLFGDANVRYSGNIVVIDGMVMNIDGVSFANYLSPEEIESISILKDASSKILYGAQAAGVINIKTKRGAAYKRTLNVHYEYGVGDPIILPSYLGAADYMELYNEACRNDGLAPRYSDVDIQATRIGYDPLQYPDIDYFSSEYMRNTRDYHKARMEASGGNNRATYYFLLGVDHNSSLLKLGENNSSFDNTVRVRGNVDLNITSWLKAKVDMAMVLNNGYSGRGSYWSMACSRRPNENSLLIPIDRLGADSDPLIEEARNQKSLIYGKYLLAGDNVYTSNLYGDAVLSGYTKDTNLATNVNIGFDMDLGFITSGLMFTTYAGIDNNNTYTIAQKNSYAVYDATFTMDPMKDLDDVTLQKYGENNFIGSQSISGVSMNRKIGWYNVLSYDRVFGGKHSLSAVATHRMSDFVTQGQIYSLRELDYGMSASYAFDRRYVAEGSAVLVASPYLQKKNRMGMAWSGGLGWVISEEGFMQGSGIDLLKLKGTYSLLLNDTSDYNYSRDTYTRGSAYTYNDGSAKNNILSVSIGNPDLTFIHDYEMNVGVEFAAFDRALSAEFNYFTVHKTGVVSTATNQYMSTLGGSSFIARQNFAEKSGAGYDLAVAYRKSLSRDFSFGVDFGMVYYDAKNIIVDEPYYGAGMEYHQKAGKSLSAIWGLVSDGLYTEEEIALVNDPDDTTLPKPSYGTVKAGDIKYLDQNGDGVIDDMDTRMIGDSRSKFNYRMSLDLRYRNFSLYAQFRAQTGGSAIYSGNYYQVYGELKYPSYLKTERWAYDPERGVDTRATATYPRLSTSGSKNNFKDSSFWMASTDYLKIPVIQLTYHFSESVSRKMGMVSPNIYLRAQNVATFAPEYEKLMLNVGSAPACRWYAIGFKANF